MNKPKATILVVDDDPTILESVAEALEIYGYHVLRASNGEEGWGAMLMRTPDLVLSDISMPDVDGYQLFTRIRSNPLWATIPFIFLTARGQKHEIRYGHSLGVDGYLVKPFELEDVRIAVESRLLRMQEVESTAERKLDRIRQQLLMVFSHELRTPLSIIFGYRPKKSMTCFCGWIWEPSGSSGWSKTYCATYRLKVEPLS